MNYQIINSFINKLDPELAHSLAIQFLKNFYTKAKELDKHGV